MWCSWQSSIFGCRHTDTYEAAKEKAGATIVFLAVGSQLVAAFAMMDQVKPEAQGVVQALQAMGTHVYMVTGDSFGLTYTLS